MKLTNFFIYGLLILFVRCKDKPDKAEETSKEENNTASSIEIKKQDEPLSLSFKGSSIQLSILDYITEYTITTFPKKTTANLEGVDISNIESATIVYSDSIKYIVEIKTGDGSNITTHDKYGNQLGSAEIFNKKHDTTFSHYKYFIVTPDDIRIHVWNYKDDNIDKEDYLHLHINVNGVFRKVDKPQSIVDYFCILPDRYLNQYFNGEIELFPDLKNSSDWYHIYKAKDMANIVDLKNGYVELVSTMALFKAKDKRYFVLTNTAGGTCETFYFYYFLNYDENTSQFTELSVYDMIPEINKFNLYQQPDSLGKYFKEDNIQLRFLPPRYGTIMKLEPYIDDCGIEDPEIFSLINQSKPLDLKWNKSLAKFEKASLN